MSCRRLRSFMPRLPEPPGAGVCTDTSTHAPTRGARSPARRAVGRNAGWRGVRARSPWLSQK